MNEFLFNPVDGLRDKGTYPTNPTSEEEARGILQAPLDQIKDFINITVKTEVEKKINSTEFENTKGDSGYLLHGNGMIENYGIVTGVTNGWKNVSYSKPFPTKCINIILTEIADTGGCTQTFIQTSTKNRTDLFAFKQETSDSRTFFYRALGY